MNSGSPQGMIQPVGFPSGHPAPRPTRPAVQNSVHNVHMGIDPEAARMARINANYEADKAMMEQESAGQPVLRRSASHDVGGAGGSGKTGNGDEIRKTVEEIVNEVRDEIDQEML